MNVTPVSNSFKALSTMSENLKMRRTNFQMLLMLSENNLKDKMSIMLNNISITCALILISNAFKVSSIRIDQCKCSNDYDGCLKGKK